METAGDAQKDRTCGPCSMCCTVLRVDEIGKRAGAPCEKLAEGGGCSIHASRPKVCRAYRCAWLEGRFEDGDRPDQLGAVVDFTPRGASFDLVIIEGSPGVFDASPRLQEIANAHRQGMPVRISDTQRIDDPDRPFRVLLADGEEHRVEGEHTHVFRNGIPVARRRLPWLERIVRRLMVASRRLRLRIAGLRGFGR